MASYPKQMQGIFQQYQEQVSTAPADLRMVGAWAMSKGLWAPREVDMQSRFAADMADALREEYRTDRAGRRYRSKLAVSNRQGVFWGDIDTSPRAHVEKNVAQRRRQTAHDLLQLQVEVDHYNDYHPAEEPIQLMLDFTEDVAEMMVGAMIEEEKAA